MHSCFGVSSEISALHQGWRWSRLYTSTPTRSHQWPHPSSHPAGKWMRCGGGDGVVFASTRKGGGGGGANGGGVPADTNTSAPMIFVSSHRMPRKDPRGQVIFVGGHICVCASMFCCYGFHISPNLSNRNRHLGCEMDCTQNLKNNHSNGIWTKRSGCVFVSEKLYPYISCFGLNMTVIVVS